MAGDKRSSTGNLFFTDQFDNHPWEAPPDINIKTPAWPPRRRNLSSQENSGRSGSGSAGSGGGGGGGGEGEVKDPAATLQAMAGEPSSIVEIMLIMFLCINHHVVNEVLREIVQTSPPSPLS